MLLTANDLNFTMLTQKHVLNRSITLYQIWLHVVSKLSVNTLLNVEMAVNCNNTWHNFTNF